MPPPEEPGSVPPELEELEELVPAPLLELELELELLFSPPELVLELELELELDELLVELAPPVTDSGLSSKPPLLPPQADKLATSANASRYLTSTTIMDQTTPYGR